MVYTFYTRRPLTGNTWCKQKKETKKKTLTNKHDPKISRRKKTKMILQKTRGCSCAAAPAVRPAALRHGSLCALVRHCCVCGTRVDFYHRQVYNILTMVPIINNSQTNK